MLSKLVAVAAVASTAVVAQDALVDKRFDWNNLPNQADTFDGDRGRQSGYNRCNSTTEGQESLCQTAHIVSVDDFCLWGPQEPNGIVGNIEGEMVAWCTKPGYGTRLIPPGALTGVQFMKTPHYVQVTGLIKQDMIYIQADDEGGEMDSAGADQRGNPLGGLVYTPSFGSNATTLTPGQDAAAVINGTGWQQVIHWHNFMGANQFCFKACDPSYEGDSRLCEHVYDRVGCGVNAPAAYKEGAFESCLGDDQLPPGVWIDNNGQSQTWYQPGEGTPIGDLPYTPVTPASSSCTSYRSEEIYAIASASSAASSSAPSSDASATTSAASGSSGTSAPVATGNTGSAASPSASSPPSAANHGMTLSLGAGVVALLGAVMML
ncbi:hypothetical protein OIO90_000451 [Microbotryomycetes sp. JL221]|nr:hypothetical protein OIO90_000451 [Microbotryomycetes sp. JL221]